MDAKKMMNSDGVKVAMTILKVAILVYLVAALWYPKTAMSDALGTPFFKGVLLLAVVVASMLDIPLAVLLTTLLIVVVIQSPDKTTAIMASANKPKEVGVASHSNTIQDVYARTPVISQDDKALEIATLKANDVLVSSEADDQIFKLAHISDAKLQNIQTSAVDPHLVGYEEDDVATIDMATVLTPGLEK